MKKVSFKSMRNRFSTVALSVICLAMATILTTSLIPHHHHGWEACLTYEVCEIDGEWNDEHTDHHCHHDDKDSHRGDDNCPLSIQNFVKPTLQSGLGLMVCYLRLNEFLNEHIFLFSYDTKGTTAHYNRLNERIPIQDYNTSRLFRAPPFC